MAPLNVWAVSAAPFELVFTQADTGEEFTGFLRGDEYGDWMETADGYSIVEVGGVWYYATHDAAGELVSSGLRVGSLSKSTLDTMPKHLIPPMPEREQWVPRSLGGGPLGAKTLSHTQNVLVILVDFSDISFTYSDASFQSLVFGATSSVKEFYLENTYGNFTVAPAAESYGTSNDGIVHVVDAGTHPDLGNDWDTWRTLAGGYISAADASVNFAAFDTNADNTLSTDELSVVLILAGYETSFSGSLSPSVWGHASSLSSSVVLDGKTISRYTAFGERHGSTGPNTHQATIGIMCHELGHLMLGLPDLYDTDGSSRGIGKWGLMGGGSWNPFDGSSPAHLCAWSKSFLDITTPSDVDTTTAGISVFQADANASIHRVWLDAYKSPVGERFLIENRQLGGYDAGLPGSGLLIWHVDQSTSSNANDAQRLVDLEEADGLNHLDSNANSGDSGDPFPGSSSNTAFNGASSPNSQNNAGQDLAIAIDNISASAPTMMVDVTTYGPIGESVTYAERGWFGNWGFDNPVAWTAINFTNTTGLTQIDGFEIFVNDPSSATIDFYFYQQMVGNTPTTLLHSELGLAASNGWNRFFLDTPQSFPQSSDRVMVLKITNASYGFPIAIDPLGVNSGRTFLDFNGNPPFSALSFDAAQILLLSSPKLMTVFANFSYTGPEVGTLENPYNSFAESVGRVANGGTIILKGTAGDTTSSWTGTLNSAMTLKSSPAGLVRIGVSGGGS